MWPGLARLGSARLSATSLKTSPERHKSLFLPLIWKINAFLPPLPFSLEEIAGYLASPLLPLSPPPPPPYPSPPSAPHEDGFTINSPRLRADFKQHSASCFMEGMLSAPAMASPSPPPPPPQPFLSLLPPPIPNRRRCRRHLLLPPRLMKANDRPRRALLGPAGDPAALMPQSFPQTGPSKLPVSFTATAG